MTGVNNEMTQHQKNIEKANQSKNPLESFPEFFNYSNNDLKITIQCKQKSDLTPKIIKWSFKLSEKNVAEFYKNCNLGWQPKIKQNYLNKTWARYLVAYDDKKQPIAFSMFRFDLDYGSAVLYCYELQIEKELQRKGLGKFMMNTLEAMAKYWKMEKIVLTILKNNEEGAIFFNKLGFSTDDTNPDEADYKILSKILY